MAKTEVILTQNIVGLGGESDNVRVAAGYARNFLFPQRLAVPVTSANKRQIEALKQRRAEREAHEFNTMSELSKALSKLICVIKVKTGEEGKLFGAVTAGMIADELKHQFDIALDKKKILLAHSIRTAGEFEVELNLHNEVKATLKVRVESTTPAVAAAEALVAEKPHTEKRGKRSEGEKTEPAEAKGKGAKAEKSDIKVEKPAKAPKAEKKERVKPD
ncbi:MAG: 50S ribosomal protein L9 [Verrucomicrobiota bacterium]|jgi:large subunit ribosomal protein L9